jgi:hypothetical protein
LAKYVFVVDTDSLSTKRTAELMLSRKAKAARKAANKAGARNRVRIREIDEHLKQNPELARRVDRLERRTTKPPWTQYTNVRLVHGGTPSLGKRR